jgi:histidinol-phosphate/aromatic aminotransferase/cobyric acid decarboxylase-like protein
MKNDHDPPLPADAAQALQWIIEKDDAGDMLYRRAGPFAERAEIAAAALTTLSAEAAALKAQVAELTRERDRFEAALARACLVGGTTYLIERAESAEAKVARLEGVRDESRAGRNKPSR